MSFAAETSMQFKTRVQIKHTKEAAAKQIRHCAATICKPAPPIKNAIEESTAATHASTAGRSVFLNAFFTEESTVLPSETSSLIFAYTRELRAKISASPAINAIA